MLTTKLCDRIIIITMSIFAEGEESKILLKRSYSEYLDRVYLELSFFFHPLTNCRKKTCELFPKIFPMKITM